MNSYQDLLAQKEALARQMAELQKQLDEQAQEARRQAVAQIKDLMAQYGVSAEELQAAPTRGRKKAEGAGDAPKAAAAKVAPKYRHPVTSETWSGRGLKPKWLAAELAAGKTLQDFAI